MNLENFLAKYGFYVSDVGASKMVFHRGHELALEEMFSLTDYIVSSVSVDARGDGKFLKNLFDFIPFSF